MEAIWSVEKPMRLKLHGSIHQRLIRLHRPIAEQIHIPHLDSFRQILQPETSGIAARPSGGDFAALCQ